MRTAFSRQAKALRDFGYPDVTVAMIEECHKAWSKGEELPHGVIGRFAMGTFDENPEIFGTPEKR